MSHLLMLLLLLLVGGHLVWRLADGSASDAQPALDRPLSAQDARGKRVTLPSPPKRIVSLSPGTTEMLFALGLKGRIVADTTYCDYPAEAKALPKIGDVNTSVEKVIAQRPDLVVASASANRRALEPLERARIVVFTVEPKTLDGAYDAYRRLGLITGQTREAQQMIKSMQSRVAAVKAAVAKDGRRPRVLLPVQIDPLMVVGSDNFMDDLVTLAGGVNAARDVGKGWVTLSPERVVVLKPDVIIAGKETAPRIRSKPGWGTIPAVRNNAIYSLRSEAARPGPRMADALEELARLLHPASFPRSR
jgi:iron complex transport system substrate-binding protein